MHNWKLHWLEAAGDFADVRSRITTEVETTYLLVSKLIDPPKVDILIQWGNWVIPEIGMVGNAYRKDLFSLTFDRGNPNFRASLENEVLRRQIAHEVHHCARYENPGYGSSLKEAIVSEGLAGLFVKEIFGNPPEPWECAVTPDVAASFFNEAVHAESYDHAAWFYGRSKNYPRSLGYTLGYLAAVRWRETEPAANGARLITVPAVDVLAVWQ